MPSSALQLIDSTIIEVSKSSGAGKLSFGLIAALWAASNGMGAITQALNSAYDLEETRPWWKQRVIAIGLTVGLSVLIIAAIGVVLGGSHIADGIAASYGFGVVFVMACA